ncbi:hypothetical protein ACO0RG_003798 [Hanseniaspora osmophila]|uniref:Histone acetyltransferase type B catalytic subunit n=1 Tax=Hanseniaspora osmophila TaxID=56408 RepID=A0A1E5REG5_9ASCO|nr:Histone acetyltransferase type B catalytic subunit [Hanseniaspora osmophila]
MDSFKPENWTASSNECVKISLLNSSTDKITTFNPSFTYPIYGDSEQIFGFKDLELILAFESKTFLPLVNIKYSEQLEKDKIGNVESNPLDTLLEYLPKSAENLVIKDEKKWVETFTNERDNDSVWKNFQKNGELIAKHSDTTKKNQSLHIYKMNISKVKDLHSRIQIFALFFIEGASYIDENDDDWDVYFLVNAETKDILGYATCYKYWFYQGAQQFDSSTNYKYRSKISQFLIFPPYQGKGYGSILYKSIYSYWLEQPNICEMTVEDPNESFDLLRDRNDLQYLIEHIDLNEIKLQVQKASLTQNFPSLCNLKLEKKQLHRLTEMLLLYLGKQSSARIMVKNRLFQKNYDALIELDELDRKDKLQSTFLTIEQDYLEIIRFVKNTQKLAKTHTVGDNQVKNGKEDGHQPKKQKI